MTEKNLLELYLNLICSRGKFHLRFSGEVLPDSRRAGHRGQHRNRFSGQSFDRVFRFSLCADLQHRHAGAGLSGLGRPFYADYCSQHRCLSSGPGPFGQGGSGRELPSVERIVHDIDPECFMTVSKISEIKGRGFSLNKKYQ